MIRMTPAQLEALGVSPETIREAKLTPQATKPRTAQEKAIDGYRLLHTALVATWPGVVMTDETIRYDGGYLHCDFVFPTQKVGVTLNGPNERLAPVEACKAGAPDWHVIPLNSVELTKATTLRLALCTIAKALKTHN